MFSLLIYKKKLTILQMDINQVIGMLKTQICTKLCSAFYCKELSIHDSCLVSFMDSLSSLCRYDIIISTHSCEFLLFPLKFQLILVFSGLKRNLNNKITITKIYFSLFTILMCSFVTVSNSNNNIKKTGRVRWRDFSNTNVNLSIKFSIHSLKTNNPSSTLWKETLHIKKKF